MHDKKILQMTQVIHVFGVGANIWSHFVVADEKLGLSHW